MNEWQIASAVVSVISAAFIAIVVLHPRISEGPVIKLGLTAMVLSLSATAYLTFTGSTEWTYYWRASFITRSGLAVVAFGLLLRARRYARLFRSGDLTHEQRTRGIMWRITEPVHDLAHLFEASSPAPLEPEKRVKDKYL